MTIEEAYAAIEAETRTATWKEANITLRVLVIKSIFEQVSSEPEEVAKKVVKRKPRKAKAAPLTQHAEGAGEYYTKLSQ